MGGAFIEMNYSTSYKYEVSVIPKYISKGKLVWRFVGNNGHYGGII